MKFALDFDKTFPHPIERVWHALTDRAALAQWLMDTDFVPEAGREFSLWCPGGDGGTDHYRCEVLELDPPRRMVWSWVLEGRESEGATRVEFSLEPVPGGTRLRLRHSGDRDPQTIEAFRHGWPEKLDALEQTLA